MPTLSAKLISMLKSVPRPQRPFNAQGGGQKKRNLKCLSDIVNMLSGGDQVSLLRNFFSSREGRPLLDQLGLEPKDTSNQLVGALRSLHSSASSRKSKRDVLSAVSPVFSRAKLWRLGFRFSPATLTRALKSTQAGTSMDSASQSAASHPNVQSAVPDADVQSAAPGGPPSPPTISNTKRLIHRFLEGHSREAANRTVTKKRGACDDPDCVAYDHTKKKYVQLMVGWPLGLLRMARIHLILFFVSQVCCPREVSGRFEAPAVWQVERGLSGAKGGQEHVLLFCP